MRARGQVVALGAGEETRRFLQRKLAHWREHGFGRELVGSTRR